MNSTFIFVLSIIAIVFTAQTIQKYMKMKSEEQATLDPELEESLAQIERLEERIRVLERIVTEHKYDLKQEISKLEERLSDFRCPNENARLMTGVFSFRT